MSRVITDITYGVTGQTFEIRALEGRPTAATFRVFNDFDSDDVSGEFNGTATVDTTSTTVDVASGPSQADPQKLSVASTSGFTVDRKYLVSENGRTEWVQPIEIVSGDYIRVRYPLKYDYTTAATVVSTTAVANVDSTWVADLSNLSDQRDPNPSYRVRWTLTINGATVIAYTYLDLVNVKVGYGVDIDDLNSRAPGLVDQLPIEYKTDNGRGLLDSAFRAFKAKLAAHQLDIDALRNDELVDELVTLKALNILALGGWKPLAYDSTAQYALDTSKEFETLFQQLVSVTLKIPTANVNGASDKTMAIPIWSK